MTAATPAAAAPLTTDRDGLATLEGLRAWSSGLVTALNDKVSGPMMAPIIKAIEVRTHLAGLGMRVKPGRCYDDAVMIGYDGTRGCCRH